MGYVGNEIRAALGRADEGGFLILKLMDDLGIVEVSVEARGMGQGSPVENTSTVYLNIDEIEATMTEFIKRVRNIGEQSWLYPEGEAPVAGANGKVVELVPPSSD